MLKYQKKKIVKVYAPIPLFCREYLLRGAKESNNATTTQNQAKKYKMAKIKDTYENVTECSPNVTAFEHNANF